MNQQLSLFDLPPQPCSPHCEKLPCADCQYIELHKFDIESGAVSEKYNFWILSTDFAEIFDEAFDMCNGKPSAIKNLFRMKRGIEFPDSLLREFIDHRLSA